MVLVIAYMPTVKDRRKKTQSRLYELIMDEKLHPGNNSTDLNTEEFAKKHSIERQYRGTEN